MEEKESWVRQSSQEASELFVIFVQNSGIKKYRKELFEKFIARYFLLKVKWAIEDLLIVFTEVCLLIILWKAQFMAHVTIIFKILFSLVIHTLLSYPWSLKGYKHGQDAAKALQRICDRNQDLFIIEEDNPDGRDQL